MAVENVFSPKPKKVTDVNNSREKDEGKVGYWENKAREARAQREYEEEQKNINRVHQPEQPPEPPFQFKGSVNLGDINYQQMLQQQQAERDVLRQQAEQNAKDMATANADLREKLHAKELELLVQLYAKDKEIFNTQMEKLTEMVQSGSSRKNFMEQYNEAMETAKALGLAQPSPQSSDLQTNLALKKLEFEQTVELRRLAREDRAEARKWQMDLRRLDDEREAKRAEQEQERKKTEMWAKAPQVIGDTLAQGVLARGKTESSPGTSKAKIGKRVEAPIGEGGEFECPECQQPVAVGETARAAVCANCGTRFPIDRIKETIEEKEE